MLSSFFTFVFLSACLIYVLLDLQMIRGLQKLGKIRVSGPKNTPLNTPLLTVLIAARNEEKLLPLVLEDLLVQDYPADRFRVLVVNDRSEDGTEQVLRSFVANHPGRIESLNVTEIKSGMSPKKNALMKGLERAKGEWIVVTDADCRLDEKWLSLLTREFSPEVGMVLGLAVYDVRGNGIPVGKGIQGLDFLSHGIVAASMVGLGFPINANANNLAYRRSAFDEAEAFRKHGRIVSGDDDFVLQEIHATGRWAIRYCVDPETVVHTRPPESWRHFWEQRKRWASKCGKYRMGPLLLLSGVFLYYAAIPAALVAGFWSLRWLELGLVGFAIKTGADFAVMQKGLRLFRLSGMLRFFPQTALMNIPLILAAVTIGTLGGFTWKGQRLTREVKAA